MGGSKELKAATDGTVTLRGRKRGERAGNKGVHMSEAGQRYIRLIGAKETHRYLFGGHSRPQRISS